MVILRLYLCLIYGIIHLESPERHMVNKVASALYPAGSKRAARILFECTRMHARMYNIQYMDVEERFGRVRHELTALSFHDRYRGDLDEKMLALHSAHCTFIEHPDFKNAYTPQWRRGLERAGTKLWHAWNEAKDLDRVSQEDVLLYVQIIECQLDKYEELSLDPCDVANPRVFALAKLVAGNFPAYQKTLEPTLVPV
jgi:hypothetical protein